MKPRSALLIFAALALLLAPPFAELVYGRSARRQYCQLIEEMKRHPVDRDHGLDLIRYGQGSGGEPWPSLRQDLWAWASRKLGLPSDLDVVYESRGSASYLEVVFGSADERPGHRSAHAFGWSPRRWRFVPTAIACPHADCPWSAPGK